MLLDTCVISELATPSPSPNVARWVQAHEAACRFSVVVIGEIACGIAVLPSGLRREQLEAWLAGVERAFAERILPIDAAVTHAWARLHASRRQLGRTLSMADGLIAATAQVHGLPVVTRNTADFAGLAGVDVVDPWTT